MEGTKPPSALNESLKELRANIDVQIEYMSVFAKLLRAKYLALIEEGFNKEQALELCKGSLI